MEDLAKYVGGIIAFCGFVAIPLYKNCAKPDYSTSPVYNSGLYDGKSSDYEESSTSTSYSSERIDDGYVPSGNIGDYGYSDYSDNSYDDSYSSGSSYEREEPQLRYSQHDLCNGTGKCNTCNGNGVRWVGDSKRICINCNGSGVCSGCNGTGLTSGHYY